MTDHGSRVLWKAQRGKEVKPDDLGLHSLDVGFTADEVGRMAVVATRLRISVQEWVARVALEALDTHELRHTLRSRKKKRY